MIVSHANNHLLTLSEFASDKANYHLKMSSKTLWAKSLHHDSELYYCRYITPHIYTQMLTNMLKHSVQPLSWLQGFHMIWWRVCLIAASCWNWFSATPTLLLLYFLVADVVTVWRHFSNIKVKFKWWMWMGQTGKIYSDMLGVELKPAPSCLQNCCVSSLRPSRSLK